jgi:hypothetical protein
VREAACRARAHVSSCARACAHPRAIPRVCPLAGALQGTVTICLV